MKAETIEDSGQGTDGHVEAEPHSQRVCTVTKATVTHEISCSENILNQYLAVTK